MGVERAWIEHLRALAPLAWMSPRTALHARPDSLIAYDPAEHAPNDPLRAAWLAYRDAQKQLACVLELLSTARRTEQTRVVLAHAVLEACAAHGESHVDVVLEDGEISMRAVTFGGGDQAAKTPCTWDVVRRRLHRHMAEAIGFHPQRTRLYAMQYDDRDAVPPNKRVSPRNRREAQLRRQSAAPLNAMQIEFLNFGNGDVPPMASVFNTPSLRFPLLCTMTELTLAFPDALGEQAPYECVLQVDGGVLLPPENAAAVARSLPGGVMFAAQPAHVSRVDQEWRRSAWAGECAAAPSSMRAGARDGLLRQCIVQRQLNSKHAAAVVPPPQERYGGECDVKLARRITHAARAGDRVLVRSTDSDVLLVLLLCVPRWLDADTGRLPFQLLLDAGSGKQHANDERVVVDIGVLHAELCMLQVTRYPGMQHFPTIYALLCALCNNDYNDSVHMVGPVTVMDTFDRLLWWRFCDLHGDGDVAAAGATDATLVCPLGVAGAPPVPRVFSAIRIDELPRDAAWASPLLAMIDEVALRDLLLLSLVKVHHASASDALPSGGDEGTELLYAVIDAFAQWYRCAGETTPNGDGALAGSGNSVRDSFFGAPAASASAHELKLQRAARCSSLWDHWLRAPEYTLKCVQNAAQQAQQRSRSQTPRERRVPRMDDIVAHVRRAVWLVIMHWANATVPHHAPNMDPLAVAPTGVSLWGWQRRQSDAEPDRTVVEETSAVYLMQ